MRGRLRGLLTAALVAAASAAPAQDDLSMGQVRSPVLTIDVDRLVAETVLGQRLSADILARGEALTAENDRIAADLTAEERSLTERRPTMEAEAFRAEADAFDQRVQQVRQEQDQKQRDLEQAVAQGRDAVLEAVRPTLAQLMRDSGAAVILERRDVFLSASAVDITDEAVAALDAAAEAGGEAPAPPPAPVPEGGAPPASGD